MGLIDLATRSRSEWERLATPLRPEGRAFINGKLVAARDGRVFEKRSPIDGRVIAQVARCSQMTSTMRLPPRARRSRRGRGGAPIQGAQAGAAALCRADPPDPVRLAMLETRDVGKPITNSVDVDVPKAADTSSITPSSPTSSTTRLRRPARMIWR